uniref:Tetratricopeptide repeat protein n=1 Tax=candidate division WOR-3 bacterium TaxID=2052148 RepID=A0A7V1EI77_UNCW3
MFFKKCIIPITLFLVFTYAQKSGESINVRCTIIDSLSRASIPLVQVRIENLQKSFITKRSGFYIPLAKGEYDIVLEAPEYEVLKNHINVSVTSNDFALEMVKLADRKKIEQQYHKFTVLLDTFNYLLKNMDVQNAKRVLIELQDYRKYGITIDEKVYQDYDLFAKKWIDSLKALARISGDSGRYGEAFYYYRRIAEFDSTQSEAFEGMRLMDSLLLAKNKPQATVKPEKVAKKTKTPEEIEVLYKSGVSKFVNGEFKEAQTIFKEVLSYNPNHEKAREYLKRIEVRIKILEGK